MRVGAVVLHYRFWPEVSQTLDALAAQDHPISHTVVVDNQSADGSADELRRRDGIEVVEADRNDGYAAGMNLGIDRLKSHDVDAVLLLTHEAALSPTSVGLLAAQLDRDAHVGAVGPLLAWRHQPSTVYSAGVSFHPRTWSTHHIGANEPVDRWAVRSPHEVDSIDGAAVLIRRSAAVAVGPIRESYFLYFEEADYFTRMRKLGWTIMCVPAALGLQQPGEPPRALWVRNNLRFLADNAPRRVLGREVLRTTYHVARDVAGGRRANARDSAIGAAAFFTHRSAKSLVTR